MYATMSKSRSGLRIALPTSSDLTWANPRERRPAAISTSVCGVEVKATFDDFMDWIRREALDEVYVDVPMDSGESFIPYLDEMESMTLICALTG